MEVSLWRMGKMTRYLNMSDLLLQDHFLFSLPALPGVYLYGRPYLSGSSLECLFTAHLYGRPYSYLDCTCMEGHVFDCDDNYMK